MIICAYEDRASAMPGLKLLLLSLARAMPDVPIDLTCPKIADDVAEWARGAKLDRLRIRTEKSWSEQGWSVKSPRIRELLDEGHDEVVWMDTDIIVHRDFRPAFAAASPDALILGQEFRAPRPNITRYRTEGWGFKFARELPFPINAGVIRCRPSHRPLLERWSEVMRRPEYLAAQALPIPQRPPMLLSDQEALTALLGSEEFADVPVHFLRCGVDVVQSSGANGYHVMERLGNTFRDLPPLIHSLGREKPWSFPEVPSPRSRRRDYITLSVLELGPYSAVARRFAREMGEPAPWLKIRTLPGRLMHWGFLGHPSLQGLPPAMLAWLQPNRLGS